MLKYTFEKHVVPNKNYCSMTIYFEDGVTVHNVNNIDEARALHNNKAKRVAHNNAFCNMQWHGACQC